MTQEALNLVLSETQLEALGAAIPLLPTEVGEVVEAALRARTIVTLPAGTESIRGVRCVAHFEEGAWVMGRYQGSVSYPIDITDIVDRWIAGISEDELHDIVTNDQVGMEIREHPEIVAFARLRLGSIVPWNIEAEVGVAEYLGHELW